MREKLVGAVLMSLVLALAGCDGDGGEGGGNGNIGGSGGGGACDGIERVCHSDRDCPTLQICDPCGVCAIDPGTKPCEDTADCSIGQACRVPEGGAELRCVRVLCESHEDCEEGEACQQNRNACIPGDCRQLGCPEGTHCREGDASCVECLKNDHCTGTDRPYCNEFENECVECEYDGDCSTGKCDGGVCVDCVTDDDCTAPQRFCRDDGACVECRTGDDCYGLECLESGRCDRGPVAGEDCDPGRVCAPGYVCLGEDPGVCFTPCDPYQPACAEGQLCVMYGDGEGWLAMDGSRPAGVCLRGGAGLAENAVCDDSHTCRADLLCLPADPTTERCRKPCDPATGGGCATGEECQGVPVGHGGAVVGFCQEPSTWFDPCTKDAECGPGLGCVLAVADGEIQPICDYTTGTAPALAPCQADEECRSDFCLAYDGVPTFCFGTCEVDADCGSGTCDTFTFNLEGGGTATVAGCRATCENDADCDAYDMFCAIGVVDKKTIITECAPGDGGAGPGEFCTAAGQCQSGACIDDATSSSGPAEDGFCLGPCRSNDDCGPHTVCRDAALLVNNAPETYDVLRACWGPPCSSSADCSGDRACTFEPDAERPYSAIRYSCLPAYGDGGPGEPCATGLDCATGICVGVGYESICYGPCATNADCYTGTYCEADAFSYPAPDGTSLSLAGCLPPY